jgi:penicillin amidase
MNIRRCFIAIVTVLIVLTGLDAAAKNQKASDVVEIPCIEGEVEVILDRDGVTHIFAENDRDLFCAEGYVHARDRFFQMDLTRRQVSGDLAEVVGVSAIDSDIQNRTIGLRRAAVRSFRMLTPNETALLQAYADGVNAYILNHPLPIEYGLLELTTVRPWDPIDSLVVGKALAALLSLDIDIGPTVQLQEFMKAGEVWGFDGQALFFEDVVRAAPMDPASTVPDATGTPPFLAKKVKVNRVQLARAAAGAKRVQKKLMQASNIARAINRRELDIGSNEWGVAGTHTSSGRPMIANDPHLSLNIPSTLYEWHLVVEDDPINGPMNVSGMGVPGTPSVILGQNEHITWGTATNPMDVSDVFQDLLTVVDVKTGDAWIESEGVKHKVKFQFAKYFANIPSNGTLNDVQLFPLPIEQTIIATVPFRSFGPILDITDPSVIFKGGTTTALVLQFTGFHATRELWAFSAWNRAQNLNEFVAGLQDFDVGSQNFAYADSVGNLAYFASAENPLRRDLEKGIPIELPPYFIRDGSGSSNWVPDPAHSQGQAIPFAILPFAEMPQTVNPENGFFVNANNDPAGVSLDNNPLNQVRPSKPTAIYYLNRSFAIGMRAGRITQLISDKIKAGKKISYRDMKKFQANTQQLDAELMTPFLLAAFENATESDAPKALAALAAYPGVAEAVRRLSRWDFSTPTGIPEGYDARDKNGMRKPSVPKKEAKASVAATIYNLWRAKVINITIDMTLEKLGLSVDSDHALKAVFNLLTQKHFTGVGVSGVDFFPEPETLSDACDRRDATLLAAMRAALDDLASDDFAPAFSNSTDQDDYRWGRLHRITFDHPLVAAFSIPPAAGFDDVSSELSGLARDGGYGVVNRSGRNARADTLKEFKFEWGPARRYVGEGGLNWGSAGDIRGVNVMPGGPSEDASSPQYATQLGPWLTADYHKVRMTKVPKKVRKVISSETFVALRP